MFNFLRMVQINFKPNDPKKSAFNTHTFEKGYNEVSEEVQKHPFFKRLLENDIVIEIANKSLKAKEAIVAADEKAKRRAGARSAKSLQHAAAVASQADDNIEFQEDEVDIGEPVNIVQ